jgi:hypothetical protein
VNSDFDLQYSGGVLQSFNLAQLRKDVVTAIADPTSASLPFVRPGDRLINPGACRNGDVPLYASDGTGRQPLGQTCSPPMMPQAYQKDAAVLGAFATDLVLSHGTRLFLPVRGDGSLTWADVDTAGADPYTLHCGTRDDQDRCDAAHHAGNNPNEPGNTRLLTMPGEPFGIAESRDHTAVAITHQSTGETSLFTTGFDGTSFSTTPALQFIVENLPVSGIGIAAVPHPYETTNGTSACPANMSCPNPSFLETNHSAPEIDLLRYYADEGVSGGTSSLARPFLVEENKFDLTLNTTGNDQRGIAIDASPRSACRQAVDTTSATAAADLRACELLPARVFVASRTPAALLLGEMGNAGTNNNQAYDADSLVFYGSVPLSYGPSKVYLGPIIDATGRYALRVFVVCFDDNAIFVYDPDSQQVENIIHVGPGPYAIAFDPFNWDDVAARKLAPAADATGLRSYRFAYVASFTDSFVQILDLDGGQTDKSTYQQIVYTLGSPTQPRGSD